METDWTLETEEAEELTSGLGKDLLNIRNIRQFTSFCREFSTIKRTDISMTKFWHQAKEISYKRV